MVDLQNQYKSIKEQVDDEIQKVVDTSAFINGPIVKQFAGNLEKYLDVKKVIPCANGTDALQIAMMGLGFKTGDEVIVPTFTYVATVEVIALLGLKPVFVDVDGNTFNIDIAALPKVLNKNTVGIVPVHLYGQSPDMIELLEIASNEGVKVIEDTAQALGTQISTPQGEKMAGTLASVGTTSFFPSKNLGCFGDGGALMTNDEVLGQRLWQIANHGQERKYYHDSIGLNSRLDSIQAAVLDVKLKYLNRYIEARQKAAKIYDDGLNRIEQIQCPIRSRFSTHSFHQYTLKVLDQSRDKLRDFLAERGIPSMIYYPLPVHLQKAYRHYGYKRGDLPMAEKLSDQVISLPIHTEIEIKEQEYIIDQVHAFYRKSI
ncbi:MAG: DegT/DnrJ/EryC1/StrS family aminotransferase [Cyclobacteriaceae bacterium]